MSSIPVSQAAGVLTITLNRPEKLNAFNPEMHQLLRQAIGFVQSFARLGLVPDSGGTYFLPRLAGTARAMGLALLGEKLSAEDAERWGLIWKAVDDDKLLAEAQLDLERDLQRDAGFSADYREGVSAFMEKREPRYQGK